MKKLILIAATLSLLGVVKPAHADVTVVIRNENNGAKLDTYSVQDNACKRDYEDITIAAGSWTEIRICEDVSGHGQIKLSYANTGDWTPYSNLHNQDEIVAPQRPASMGLTNKAKNDDDE